jgi:small ubiquitin-related modifier
MSGATPEVEEDKKPNVIAGHIKLKVNSQVGIKVSFKIKRNTKLKELMNAYSDQQSIELNTIVFLYDGR